MTTETLTNAYSNSATQTVTPMLDTANIGEKHDIKNYPLQLHVGHLTLNHNKDTFCDMAHYKKTHT